MKEIMDTAARAKDYHRIKNRLFAAGLLLDFIILSAIVLSGFAKDLRIFLDGAFRTEILLAAAYSMVISFIIYFLSFPLGFYESFWLEHKYNLSAQNILAFIKDNLKKSFLSLAVFIISVEFIYFFLRNYPGFWWAAAGVGYFFLAVVVSKITPNFILPLFYKYITIEDTGLKDKILEMFSLARINLKDVYMINFSAKTRKLNAAVIGFGRNKRVILTDNLLKELSHEEILSIAAHEIGHYKNRDTAKIILFGFFTTLALFYLSGAALRGGVSLFGYESISDIASLPLFGLVMFCLGLFILPLQNCFMRRLEIKADAYALNLTKQPQVFVSMMEKLAKANLADLAPSKLVEIMLYDHPPIARRIRMAQSWGR